MLVSTATCVYSIIECGEVVCVCVCVIVLVCTHVHSCVCACMCVGDCVLCVHTYLCSVFGMCVCVYAHRILLFPNNSQVI